MYVEETAGVAGLRAGGRNVTGASVANVTAAPLRVPSIGKGSS